MKDQISSPSHLLLNIHPVDGGKLIEDENDPEEKVEHPCLDCVQWTDEEGEYPAYCIYCIHDKDVIEIE